MDPPFSPPREPTDLASPPAGPPAPRASVSSPKTRSHIASSSSSYVKLGDDDPDSPPLRGASRKGKSKAKQREPDVEMGVVDGAELEDGRPDSWGSGTAYPPVQEDEEEEKRIAENLKRWEEAERQRRRAARASKALSTSSPTQPAPSAAAALARRTTLLMRGSSERRRAAAARDSEPLVEDPAASPSSSPRVSTADRPAFKNKGKGRAWADGGETTLRGLELGDNGEPKSFFRPPSLPSSKGPAIRVDAPGQGGSEQDPFADPAPPAPSHQPQRRPTPLASSGVSTGQPGGPPQDAFPVADVLGPRRRSSPNLRAAEDVDSETEERHRRAGREQDGKKKQWWMDWLFCCGREDDDDDQAGRTNPME